MNAGVITLILKIAVIAVTILWLASLVALASGKTRLHGRINIASASLVALASGKTRLHGRINIAFFGLTLAALLGLEVIVRLISPGLFDDYFTPHEKTIMTVHLCFSVPSAVLLFAMLFSGLKHHRSFHIATGVLFSVLWIGTFVTGVFFLPDIFFMPHAAP